MKEITKKLNAYMALVKSNRFVIKELRKCGFRFDPGSSYGNIFQQVAGFSMENCEYL